MVGKFGLGKKQRKGGYPGRLRKTKDIGLGEIECRPLNPPESGHPSGLPHRIRNLDGQVVVIGYDANWLNACQTSWWTCLGTISSRGRFVHLIISL